MIKEKGMVLLTAVLFIVLLNLLVLTELKMIFVHYKSLNQLKQKHEFFFQFESLANELISNQKNLAMTSLCLVAEHDPNEMAHLLKNKKSCKIKFNDYEFYYLIEKLGVFPCLQTESTKNQQSTEHFRMNIMAQGKYQAFLQIRLAKAAPLEVCETLSQKISTGILSWRYLREPS